MKFARICRRILLWVILAKLAAVVAAALIFNFIASGTQQNFRPVHDPVSPEQLALAKNINHYLRPEESTYLTFPEWYLVFNPQEYAQFLRTNNRPSAFPYFKSIGQFWGGYAQVYGITKRNYPFNLADHVVEVVIGSSFTAEFIFKGAYENTIGRLSEWTAGGGRTKEDDYAAKVAQEYGDFIPTQPWYDFPFGHALAGLWTSNGFAGEHFLRKCERKFFLTIEYGVKTVYASIIRAATHTVYGIADTEVFGSAENVSPAALAVPGVRKIQDLENGAAIIAMPHYQGFTETAPQLARAGVQFLELAGNDEILLTVLAPNEWKYDLREGAAVFTMQTLNNQNVRRFAVQAPVKSLAEMLREFEARGIKIEHLFDY